ncbi:oligosaccharide flippase family protein [Metabacillus sp. cB07]|uniref:oligosaccharide flippase family protein n=1 Tax=Metabacillus sp. cB07 TaxID=2806989 RepID=UPI00193A73EE|nr:oligosaccharide flippase family protein [Metabacillus sp. cB07]
MKVNQKKAGVLLSYILTITNALVGFIYIPFLIYSLGQGEYGLFQLMGSILIYLGLFDGGLSNTVTRYYSRCIALKDEKGKENILFLSTIIYFIFTLVLILVGIIFYFYLDEVFINSLTSAELETAHKMYVVILITVVITISTAVFNSIITAHEKFVFLKSLAIIQTIIRPVIVFAVFTIEANALILIVIQAGISILGVVFKILYTFKKLKVKIRFHSWDKTLLKEMFGYSFYIFIGIVMDQIFWRSDQVILGIIDGTASVAIYSIAAQIIMYYMTLSTATSGVFLPSITKKVVSNAPIEELSSIFIKVGRLQYLILGSIVTGFILFGKEFIIMWVGEDFVEAYYITLVIMIPFTIDLIQNIGLTILQAKNMYGFRTIVFLGMALLKVVISIPLAIQYGGLGPAIATSAAYIVGNGIIMNIYYHKKIRINIIKFWSEIGKISILLLIMIGPGVLISYINLNSQVLSLLIKLVLFLMIYILLMWKLGMNKYEKDLILTPLNKIIRKLVRKGI